MSGNEIPSVTGEWRRVMEEVAEKAANSAVEKMALKIQLDLMQMERRMADDLSETIEERINKALGMSAQDHIIAHDQMRRTSEFFGDLRMAFWKRVIVGVIFAALAFLGGYATDLKLSQKKPAVETHAITRDENHQPKEEGLSASNP